MATGAFSPKEALSYAWEKTRSNLKFFVKLLLFVFLITQLPRLIMDIFGNLHEKGMLQIPDYVAVIFLLISVVLFILSRIVDLGIIKISLGLYDNREARVFDVFSCWRLFFKYVASMLLYGLMVVIGLVLLVVPGIILAVRCGFFPYFIIEEGLGPIASLKRSYEITKGSFRSLFLLDVLSFFIIMVGALVFLVGLFVAIPVCYLAFAWVYRKLKKT